MTPSISCGKTLSPLVRVWWFALSTRLLIVLVAGVSSLVFPSFSSSDADFQYDLSPNTNQMDTCHPPLHKDLASMTHSGCNHLGFQADWASVTPSNDPSSLPSFLSRAYFTVLHSQQRWDALFNTHLAQFGYPSLSHLTSPACRVSNISDSMAFSAPPSYLLSAPKTAAFFPLLPFLIRRYAILLQSTLVSLSSLIYHLPYSGQFVSSLIDRFIGLHCPRDWLVLSATLLSSMSFSMATVVLFLITSHIFQAFSSPAFSLPHPLYMPPPATTATISSSSSSSSSLITPYSDLPFLVVSLFVLSPSAPFTTTAYTESLFSFLSFLFVFLAFSLTPSYCFSSLSFISSSPSDTSLVSTRFPTFSSCRRLLFQFVLCCLQLVLAIALSLTRSNAVALALIPLASTFPSLISFLSLPSLRSCLHWATLYHVLHLTHAALIVLALFLPNAAFQSYMYSLLCHPPSSVPGSLMDYDQLPLCNGVAPVDFGLSFHLGPSSIPSHLSRLAAPFPSFPIYLPPPPIYMRAQSYYWDIGFLHYFRLSQLPNFLLALPSFVLVIVALHLFVHAMTPLVVAISPSTGNSLSYTYRLSHFLSPHLPYIHFVQLVALGTFAFFFMHVQVTPRFLLSSPACHWVLALILKSHAGRLSLVLESCSLTSILRHIWFQNHQSAPPHCSHRISIYSNDSPSPALACPAKYLVDLLGKLHHPPSSKLPAPLGFFARFSQLLGWPVTWAVSMGSSWLLVYSAMLLFGTVAFSLFLPYT